MKKWFFHDNNDTGLVIPKDFYTSQEKGCVLALGYFDGMHRGHQKVFSEMRTYADKYNVKAVAQTFSGIPKSKAIKSAGRGLLTTIEEKCVLMSEAGSDSVVFFPFSEHFSSVSAPDFLKHYILELFEPKALVVGHDYRFGKSRKGDVVLLKEWGITHGIDILIVSPEIHQEKIISSSWVRERILSADLDTAAELLGRLISYSGKVVTGQKLGQKLGFPTANIFPDEEKIVPPHGVYISFVQTDSGTFESITNIGTRPTVSGASQDKEVVIESVVLDKEIDLYGKNITVHLAKMVREEKRFDDLESLTLQVKEDISRARNDHKIYSQQYASYF